MGDCSREFKVELPNLMQPASRSPSAREIRCASSWVMVNSLVGNGCQHNVVSSRLFNDRESQAIIQPLCGVGFKYVQANRLLLLNVVGNDTLENRCGNP